MLNLLKADLFILRKSKVFKISLGLMIVIIVGFSFTFSFNDRVFEVSNIIRHNRMYGFAIGKVAENKDYINFLRSSLGYTIFICVVMIFIVVDLVVSRYNNGTLRNTISYGHNRYKIYISNMLSIIIGVLAIALISIILSMVLLTILFIPDVRIKKLDVTTISNVTITWTIIMVAMTSFYIMISTIVKNKTIITTWGVCFIVFISYSLFDKISLRMQSKIPIYMILDICGQPQNNTKLGIFIINSIIIFLISTIIGCIVFSNQEIK